MLNFPKINSLKIISDASLVLNFTFMCIPCVFVEVVLLCADVHKGEKRVSDLSSRVPALVSHPMSVLGTNSGSLQEQFELLTNEPSLCCFLFFFLNICYMSTL